MGTNVAEEVEGTGSYVFSMTTYDNTDTEIDTNNAAEIGEEITLKVTPTNTLPSNVEFQLIDCTAVQEFAVDGNSGGRSATEVGLKFNSFTFEAADDQLNLVCDIKLCLTTDTDCNNVAQKMTTDTDCNNV